MAEMPRIVRERLREQPAGEHPDANVLSALSEHALSEGERAHVMEHLSRCSECRGVLALAQLSVEELQPGGVFVPSRSWWRSPVVHWSALITAAVVVLIAVAMHPHRERPAYVASAPAGSETDSAAAQPTAIPTAENQERTPAPAPEKKSAARKVEARVSEEPRATKAKMPAGLDKPAPPAVGGTERDELGFRAGIVSGTFARNAPASPPPPAQPAQQQDSSAGSQSSTTVEVQSQAAAPEMTGRSMGMKDSGSAQAGYAGGVAAAAPAPKSETAILNKSTARSMALRASLSPRWSISDSGALQRSLDGGRSWTVIDVAKDITFRAVAAVGSDIWAGGSATALYHSSDGGESWWRVLVRDRTKNRTLSGDIVHLEVRGTHHVLASTSARQVWTSQDDGTTWHLQLDSIIPAEF